MIPNSMPNLKGHTARDYPGWDLKVSDQRRVDQWLKHFAAYVRARKMPTVQFVALPRDHSYGTLPYVPAPAAMNADNDLALGRIVAAVSQSDFWKDTAIFVVEDDAQNGADHVDGHRTVAQIISPHTQHGTVDSTFYSTVSMLHTMRPVVGVPPMTQFDATSTPMWRSFSATPDLTPYDAIRPRQMLNVRNPANGPLAAVCERMDFSRPDRCPPEVIAAAIWKTAGRSVSRPPEHVAVRGDEDD